MSDIVLCKTPKNEKSVPISGDLFVGFAPREAFCGVEGEQLAAVFFDPVHIEHDLSDDRALFKGALTS